MRDDSFKGTKLPRLVRRLCRMAERAADRAHPERLRQRAVAALCAGASREIHPEFLRQLRAYHSNPDLFAAIGLAKLAKTRLETEIALNMEIGGGPEGAISEALRQRGEGYSRDLRDALIAERHPQCSVISESVESAFDAAALIAAQLVLNDCRTPRPSDRVRLDENLLVRPVGGAGI